MISYDNGAWKTWEYLKAILAQAISCSSNPVQQCQPAWVERVFVLSCFSFAIQSVGAGHAEDGNSWTCHPDG